MRKASFAAVTLLALAATVALSSRADAACRNCWIGGVIYGYTPAYYYTLYGPPNPDRPVRSAAGPPGPYYSFRDYSVRRTYTRRYYRM